VHATLGSLGKWTLIYLLGRRSTIAQLAAVFPEMVEVALWHGRCSCVVGRVDEGIIEV
jgi:hypothetical protein